MNVFQINSVCGIRSTGRICTDIAEVLRKNGHCCNIAYGREEVPEKFAEIGIKTDSCYGVAAHAALSRIFDNAGFLRRAATERFCDKMESYSPDIIHLHNIHGYYINVETLFERVKALNKPVVWTLHDCWAFTGHCTHFERAECNRWKSGCEQCPQKKSYPKSILFDNSKKNYNRKREIFTGVENMVIVTPSKWLADFVKESYLGEYPVKVIHNGIDTKIFKVTDSDLKKRIECENKKIVLGVASSWGKTKGLDDMCCLPELLGENYKVVIVGVNEEQKRNLPPEIVGITGTNSKEKLAEIYTAADVFVNFTYADNYPTVNLEAQCCGTPVITYRTGGSVESVPENQVVDRGDIISAVKKITEICETGKYELNDGKFFDREYAGEKYIELYQNMLYGLRMEDCI